MSDTTIPQLDQMLDVLRQRETDLVTACQAHEIEGRILAGRLQELRDLIAACSRKPRPARRPRAAEATPAADALAPVAGAPALATGAPAPVTAALDAAFASLGRPPRRLDAELADAA